MAARLDADSVLEDSDGFGVSQSEESVFVISGLQVRRK